MWATLKRLWQCLIIALHKQIASVRYAANWKMVHVLSLLPTFSCGMKCITCPSTIKLLAHSNDHLGYWIFHTTKKQRLNYFHVLFWHLTWFTKILYFHILCLKSRFIVHADTKWYYIVRLISQVSFMGFYSFLHKVVEHDTLLDQVDEFEFSTCCY